MGNCIDDYRAAIGLFHIRITGNRRPFKVNFPVYTYQEILLTNFRCTFLVVSLSLLQSLNPNIDIVFLLFVLQYILIIGNVHHRCDWLSFNSYMASILFHSISNLLPYSKIYLIFRI